MKKCVCDRCGTIIEGPWGFEGEISRKETSRRVISDIPEETEFDLCSTCVMDVIQYIKGKDLEGRTP